MSLKAVLGTLLASRMAGRGGGRGMMGSAAMLATMGRGRRGFGGKAGLAGMAFMAYQAYQSNQANAAKTDKPAQRSTPDEGFGVVLKELAGRFGFGDGEVAGSTPRDHTPDPEMERAAADFSDAEALLLIRAMITAAHSDGSISADERAHILLQVDTAGVDAETRRTVEQEIENPRPLDELLTGVQGSDMAQRFYLASRAAMDRESQAQKAYLITLREKLKLSPSEIGELEQFAT